MGTGVVGLLWGGGGGGGGSREPVCTEWPRLVLGYWGGEHSDPGLPVPITTEARL